MAKTKKRQKKDFQKVKLKVGRKIKPANETLPHVRIGHIQIRKQFAPEAESSGAKTQAKIKDLLKMCDNAKVQVRYNSIQRLRECFTTTPMSSRFSDYFYRLLAVIPTLFIDEDAGTRSEARRFLSWIFSTKDFDQVFDPGDRDLNLILPYLRLAMNHSHEDVKVDSLALLDIIITCPRLILYGTSTILKDLLVLISTQRRSQLDKTRRQAGGTGPLSKKNWLLATNPESRLAQQKWRASVLERLTKFFQILYDSICGEKRENREVTQYGTYVDVKSALSDPAMVQLLTDNLIPLLFECWIETGFQKSGSEQTLDHVSISILQNALKVMRILICITKKIETFFTKNGSTFLLSFEKQCVQHFCSGFPFQIIQKKSKRDESAKDVSISFNILVSFILLHFNRVKGGQLTSCFIQQMASYVITVLRTPHYVPHSDIREVVVKLVDEISDSDANTELCENLVNAVLGVFSDQIPNTDQQRNWFDMCSMLFVKSAIDKPKQWHRLTKFQSVQEWFASLHDLYLTMGRTGHKDLHKVNDLIYQLIMQEQNGFRKQFTKNLSAYLDKSFLSQVASSHIEAVPLSNSVTPSNCLARFLETVCYATKIELSNWKLLMQAALNGVIPPEEFARFCDSIAQSCFRSDGKPQMASVDFLEFRSILMNALIAGFCSDVEACMETDGDKRSSSEWIHVTSCHITSVDLQKKWTAQRELVENAVRTIGLLPDCVERLKEVLGFIKSALETYPNLEILSACSLGVAMCCCPHIASPFGPSFNEIGEHIRHPLTNLLLGLIECIEVDTSDKTLDEYMTTQPPLEVVVLVLQTFLSVLDDLLTQIKRLVTEQRHSRDLIGKFVTFLAILKRDTHLNMVTSDTIEHLMRQFSS